MQHNNPFSQPDLPVDPFAGGSAGESLVPLLRSLLQEVGVGAASIWSTDPEHVRRQPRLLAHAGSAIPDGSDSHHRSITLRSGDRDVGVLVLSHPVGSWEETVLEPAVRQAGLFTVLVDATQLRLLRDVNRRLCLELAVIADSIRQAPNYGEACTRLTGDLARLFHATAAVLLAGEPGSNRLREIGRSPARPGKPAGPGMAELRVDSCPAIETAWTDDMFLAPWDKLSGADREALAPFVGDGADGDLLAFAFGAEQAPEWLVLLRGTPDPMLIAGMDRHRLRALGQRFGWLLAGRRIQESLALNLRNFEQLLALSNSVASVLEPEEIPGIVTQRAVALCEADEAVLCVMEPDGVTLRPIHCISEYPEEILRLRRRIGEGITGAAAAGRKAEIVNYAEEDPRSTHVPGTPAGEREAILAAPLISGDKLVGVLTLHKLEGRTFHQVDLDTISIFATQAAVAIENARLFAGIRAEQTRLATMVRHMHEAVVFADAQGRVTLLNDAASALFPDCREGDGIDRLLAAPGLDPVREVITEVGESEGGGRSVEVTQDGRTFLCSVSSVPGPTPEERLGVVLLLQDLSEHRRMHARLLESSKMSAVGQLAAGVAHEFNNLITGIYGYAQLLKIHPDAATIERGVNVILRSSERAQQLTGSLLTFSRRRTGRRELVQPADVLRDTLLLLEGELQKEGITLVQQTEGLPSITADPGELQQVFLNLVINALQALRGHGGTIRVSGSSTDSMVEITVADDGPGVLPEHRERVFEPFFTTKGSLAGAPVPGVGLGLTTAFNIVETHGGTLTLDATEEPGAVFRIRLPRQAVVETVAPPSSGQVRSIGLTDRPHVGITIVDPVELETTRSVLSEIGCRVSSVDAQDHAFNTLLDNGLDLLILDGLPGSGSASPYVTARTALANLPIVFLVERNEGQEFPGLADSWAFLLRKPYRRRDMATVVTRLLQHASRRAS